MKDERFEKGRQAEYFNENERQQRLDEEQKRQRDEKLAKLTLRERIDKAENLLTARQDKQHFEEEISRHENRYDPPPPPGYSSSNSRQQDRDLATAAQRAQEVITDLEQETGLEHASEQEIQEMVSGWNKERISEYMNSATFGDNKGFDRGYGED